MEQTKKQKIKRWLIRIGSSYLLVIVALLAIVAVATKTSHELEADATISGLTVTATLPASDERMVSVGSFLDIPFSPDGETPYRLRLPVDSLRTAGDNLILMAHLDSTELVGLNMASSFEVIVNTHSMSLVEYCFGK